MIKKNTEMEVERRKQKKLTKKKLTKKFNILRK